MLNSPYIIAEIASAHEGKFEKAIEIAHLAAKAGADAVKFQIFNKDKLLTKTNPFFDEFSEIEITYDNWIRVLKETSQNKIDIIVEPYDIDSFLLAEETSYVNRYKIPSANITDLNLLNKIDGVNKKMLFAVGGAKLTEIENIFSIIDKTKVTLLAGFQSFPTKLKDSGLIQISNLIKMFNCAVGYADHVDAEDLEMSRMVSSLAIARGATVVEKHITIDRSIKGRDYYSSLEYSEFKSFVELIKKIPLIIGSDTDWKLSEAEIKYRNFTKKHAVASKNLQSEKPLSYDDITYKRTNEDGISEAEIDSFIGKKLINPKKEDDHLLRSDFR